MPVRGSFVSQVLPVALSRIKDRLCHSVKTAGEEGESLTALRSPTRIFRLKGGKW